MHHFRFDDKFFRDRGNEYFRQEDYHPALLLYSFCIGLIDKTTKDKSAKAKVLCNRSACWRKLSATQSAYDDAWNALSCDKKYWRSYHWLVKIYEDINLLDYVPKVVAACFANCSFPTDEFSSSAALDMYVDYLDTADPPGYSSRLRRNRAPLTGASKNVANGVGDTAAGCLRKLKLSSAAWNCLLNEMKRQQRRNQLLAFTLAELRSQSGPSVELAAPFNDPTYLINLTDSGGTQTLRQVELVEIVENLATGGGRGGGGWNASLFDRVWPSLTPDRVTEQPFRARVAGSLLKVALNLAPHSEGQHRVGSCSAATAVCPLARSTSAARAISLGVKFAGDAPPILHLLAGHLLLAKSAPSTAPSSSSAAAAASKAALLPSNAARLAARAYLAGLADSNALKSLGSASGPLLSSVLAEIAALLDGGGDGGGGGKKRHKSSVLSLRKAFLRSSMQIQEAAIWLPAVQYHLTSRNYLALCQLLVFGSGRHRFSGPALESLKSEQKRLCRSAPTRDLLALPPAQWRRYGERLLTVLCLLGLDPNSSLAGHMGATCFHTAIVRAMQTGSLDLYRFLFYFYRPRAVDTTGDTLLHLIGAAREAGEIHGCKYSKEFACTAIQLLVRYGHVNPQALNKKGRKAVDYYKPSDAEYGYLQYPETCLSYTDPGERVYHCWFYYFAQRLGVQPERTDLLLADAASLISEDGGGAYLCQSCELSLEKYRGLSKREELLRFYGTLLHEDHKREFSKSHADLLGRLLPDLLELLSQGDLISPRIIPESLLKPPALLACLLHGLFTLETNTAEDGSFKCWKSIHLLLKCYYDAGASEKFASLELKRTLEHGLRLYLGVHAVETIVADVRQGSVAAIIRLQDLLLSGYQRGEMTKRMELVELLRRAGAQCDLTELEPSQVRKFARDVPQLMQLGLLGSDCLGEYPLHKALSVALDVEPGFFDLFEYLVSLYKTDPDLNPQLDPCVRDEDGNTLYHVAAATRSRHSVEAVRKISELTEANPNLRNKARQTALQAINRTVRRREHAQMVLQLTQVAARFPAPEPVDTRPDQDADGDGDDSEVEIESEDASAASIKQWAGDWDSMASKSPAAAASAQQQTPLSQFDQMLQWFNRKLERLTKDDINDMTRNPVRAPNPRDLAQPDDSDGEDDEDGVENGDDAEYRQLSPSDELAGSDDEAGNVGATLIPDVSELDWEIECTVELWNALRRHRNTWRQLKRRLATRLLQLASGRNWSSLAEKIRPPTAAVNEAGKPLNLQLYKTSLGGQAILLWERAVNFSPKRSGPHGRIYCDVLRLWAIVESPEALDEEVSRAVTAHRRGAECALARELNAAVHSTIGAAGATENNVGRVLPRTYSVNAGGGDSSLVRFQPPGASKDTEYHIMKFYNWDASLIHEILNGDTRIDLPFRVTEQEHAVIELSSDAPVLLIGRSGTGKTTCCVFRMFSAFADYWRQAGSVANPLIPRQRLYKLVNSEAADDAGSDEDADTGDDAGEAAEVDAGEQHQQPNRGRNRGRARNRNRTTNSTVDTYDEESAVAAANVQDNVDNYDADAPEPQCDHLRQLFVTKNPVLCREVRKNFYDLCAGLRDVELPEPELDLPLKLQQATTGHFPMFVSSKQMWMLLDASLPGQPFFQRNEDGSLTKRVPGWEDEEADIEFLLDSNADDLFEAVNYEHGGGVNGDEGSGANQGGTNSETADQQQQQQQQQQEDRRREVTYELFSTKVWEKIPSKLRSGLQPSLVWTELVSFIKGSLEALNSPNGYLSLPQYCMLGRKRAPEFSDSRERVYKVFEEYQRLLRDLCLFDMCDFVVCLYRRQTVWLAESAPPPEEDWALHAVFVDETQDFTQAELSLLLRCCQDPNRMFFTGDTAQSIMRGVSFRFVDLRNLFYHARLGLQSRGAASALRMPDGLKFLTHNYRSHSGILGLASCVILLLGRLFPSTFDPLEPDMGLFRGPDPVLIESCSATDLAFLLQGVRRKSNAHIDFGAHQAIIVASDEARRDLVKNVPELSIALVLTVYESKGLEFDDVLLYNFFKYSPAGEKDWRVISAVLRDLVKEAASTNGAGVSSNAATPAALLKQLDLGEYAKRSSRPIEFNAGEHKILNSVLKHLYTAVTRARVNVWIFDENEEVRKPMFEFFKTMKVVKVVASGSESLELSLECADGFASTSSPEQWRAKGHEFYCRRLFDLAAKCYNRSGDAELKQLAEANGKALRALKITEARQQREEFVSAARIYLTLGWAEQAAKCLEHGKQPLLAANLFQLLGQYNRVFRVFDKTQNYQRAAEALQMAGFGGQAAKYLMQHKLYVEAFEARQQAKREIEQRFAGDATRLEAELARLPDEKLILLRGAKAYKNDGNKEKLEKMVESLPLEERVTFFVEQRELQSAAAAYAAANQKREAALFMYDHGFAKEAWHYAQEADDDQLLSQCATALAEHAYARWQRRPTPETQSKAKAALEIAVGKAELVAAHQDAGYCRLLLGDVTQDIRCLQQAFVQMRKISCEIGLVYILRIVCHNESILDYEPNSRSVWMRELLLPLRLLGDLVINFDDRCSAPNQAVIRRTYSFLGLTEKSRLMDLQLRPAGHPQARRLLHLSGRPDKVATVSRPEASQCVHDFCHELIGDAFPWLFLFLQKDALKQAFCPGKYQGDSSCLMALSIESSSGRCAYQHEGDYETPEQFRDMALAAGFLLRLGRLLHQHRMARTKRLDESHRQSITRDYAQRMEDRFKYNDYIILFISNVFPTRAKFQTRHPVILPAINEFLVEIEYFYEKHKPSQPYYERLVSLLNSLINRPQRAAAAAAKAARLSPTLDPESLPEILRQFVPTEEFCGVCGLQLRPDDEDELDLPHASTSFGFMIKLPSVSAHQASDLHLQRLVAFKYFASLVTDFLEKQRHWNAKLDELEVLLPAKNDGGGDSTGDEDGGGVSDLRDVLQTRRRHFQSMIDRLEKAIETDIAKLIWEHNKQQRTYVNELKNCFHEQFVRYFHQFMPNFSFSQGINLAGQSQSAAARAPQRSATRVEPNDWEHFEDWRDMDEKPYHDVKDEFIEVKRSWNRHHNKSWYRNNNGGPRYAGSSGGGGGRFDGHRYGGGGSGGPGGDGGGRTNFQRNLPPRMQKKRGQ